MNQHKVQELNEIEHTWVPMPDGCKLAARIWMPKKAETNPVPAILEYIPYRIRDFTAYRDSNIHRYFAQNGFACIRVDLRGSGDSDGILYDEYLEQELQDGVETLKWISQQPWCDGNVGMIGLSWGGFNGLQIAALQPECLKAVITVCSSDDRYSDDVHYMGGCLLTDNLSWASTMFAYNSCPPDPLIVGEKWKEMWLERLEKSGLWIKTWLEHQRRDEYWKHASVCNDYSAIQCPIYAVSGWADGYSNSVFRLMQNLKVPRKGLIGAWGHKYPHMGNPGPAIGFLNESLRWWNEWLKGENTGIMDEPMLRVWMQDTYSPVSEKRPGRWVAEDSWPSPNVSEKVFHIAPGDLLAEPNPSKEKDLTIQSPLSVGLFAGKWCSYSAHTDLPSDQREEDGGSWVLDTEELEHPIEIMGMPYVNLELSANKPIAMAAVRLSDVAPDGKATRVSYGLLNLTHRESDEEPTVLEPGKKYNIRVNLNYIAQRFPKGNRIRLSVSTSYWPLAWPSPEPVMLTLTCHNSQLILPVRPLQTSDEHLKPFQPADGATPIETTLLAPSHREWTVLHNLANNKTTLKVVNNDAKYRINQYDLTLHRTVTEEFSYIYNQYDTVRAEVDSMRRLERADWSIVTYTRTVVTSTPTHFRILATLDAYNGDKRVFSKSWDESIERDYL